MSYIVSGLVQRRVFGSATIKSVIMLMASTVNDDGSGVWTSKGNIAKDLELSRRGVQNAIQALLDMGAIAPDGERKCVNGFTVQYRICIEVVEALPSTRSPVLTRAPGAPLPPPPVHPVHPYPCTPCTPTRAPRAHKQSLEQPLEQSIKSDGQPSLFPEPISEPKKAKKPSGFPEDWAPDEKAVAFAVGKGFNRSQTLALAEACVLHHRGKGSTFADHGAAFRTWVLNDIRFNGEPASRGRPATTSAAQAGPAMEGIMRRLAQRREEAARDR